MRTIDDCNDNNYRYVVQQPKRPEPPTPVPAAKVASDALLGVRRELVIAHNSREYRLRVTQNGKLILTA
jgi:hemin uptake protein HemP